MGFSVIDVQSTPNPNAMKFTLDRQLTEAPTSFLNSEQATNHPLAARLFAITGVSSLLLLGDFVTVNKKPDATWPAIVKRVKQALAED